MAEQRSPKPQVGGSSPSSRAENPEIYPMKQKIIDFFEDVVKEMKKVTWPTKEELINSTNVVIAVCIVMAVLAFVIDKGITSIFQGIF